jgi:pyruvate dehydrogenase E1 component alpha subunit
MNREELIAFEAEVADAFLAKRIRGPIHLAGGNEDQLIEIFREVKPADWVLSTWRSHYHALLKGIPPEKVMSEILAGRSMALHFPEHRFLTSAIVGGICPIAVGLASQGERVWCFVGDMAAMTGIYHESYNYSAGHHMEGVRWVIENNGYSTNTPTRKAWGVYLAPGDDHYEYARTTPHCGCGTYVAF